MRASRLGVRTSDLELEARGLRSSEEGWRAIRGACAAAPLCWGRAKLNPVQAARPRAKMEVFIRTREVYAIVGYEREPSAKSSLKARSDEAELMRNMYAARASWFT